MKIKSLLGAISLSLAFSPTINAEVIIPADSMDFAQLGMPYNTHTKEIHNFICVNAAIDNQSGAPSASFNFEHNMDYRKTMNALTGTLSVGIDYPLVKLDAGANIVDEFRSDEYSSSWTAYAIAIPDVVRLNPSQNGFQLSSKCQEYSSLFSNDTEGMMSKAGDEFISQINRGASLLVQMRLNFANRHQKDTWDANAKYSSIGTWKLQIEGYLENLSEKEKNSISVEIKAYQNGGEAASLAEILPNNVMSCSTSDIQACEEAFEQALTYANDFGSQLTDADNYNVLSFTTSSYSEAGIYEMVPPQSDLEPINQIYLDQLDALFGQQLNDRRRSLKMLGEYSRFLEADWIDQLSLIKRRTDQNAYMISKVADICFRFPYGEECAQQYTALTGGGTPLLYSYDRSYLYLPAPTLTVNSEFGSSQSFTGTQALFGNDAPQFNLVFDNEVTIENGENKVLHLDMTYTNSCSLKVSETDSIAVVISESGSLNLGAIYTPEFEAEIFNKGSLLFTPTIECVGLGGDIKIDVPLVAKVPAASLKIDTATETLTYNGTKLQFFPNEGKYYIEPPSIPVLKQGTTSTVLLTPSYTQTCGIYNEEISSTTPITTFTNPLSFNLESLFTNSVYQSLLTKGKQQFYASMKCTGIGGDLYVQLKLNAYIDELRDSDGDGLKDSEEINTYGTDPFKADTDGDGINDKEELPYCYDPENEGQCQPNGHYPTDPLNPDTDNDGLNDYDDQFTYPTFPNDSDSDNDGLNDYQEVKIHLTNPRNNDTDNDGYSDGQEVSNGTNPLVPDAPSLSAKNDYYELGPWGNSCQNVDFTIYPLNNDIGSNLRILSASSTAGQVDVTIKNSGKSLYVETDRCYFQIRYTVTDGSTTDQATIYIEIDDY